MSIPKNAVNRLAKLPAELSIVDFISHPNADEIIVDIPRPDVVPCPYCVSEHCIIKGHRNRSVRHLAFGSRGTMVTFGHRRYICRDCHRSFQEPLYWVIDSIRITTALYLSVCKDLQTVSSIRDISSRNGVSEAVTRHILDVTPAYVAPHVSVTY